MTRRKLVNPVRVPGISSELGAERNDWILGDRNVSLLNGGEQTEALNCCVHERSVSPALPTGTKRAAEGAGGGENKRQALDFSLSSANFLLGTHRRQANGENGESVGPALAQILPPLCGLPNFPGLPESLLLHPALSSFLPVDFSSIPKPPSADLIQVMPALQPAYAAVVARALDLKQAVEAYKVKFEMAKRKKASMSGSPSLPASGALPAASPIPMLPRSTGSEAVQSRSSGPSPEPDLSQMLKPGINGKQRIANISTPRRRNDRRSDAEMNEPNRDFQPETYVDSDAVEQVRLSNLVPEISLPRETYLEIMKKGETSATRVIRMLMKHFFAPEVLAASSLSGTGTYKQILNENTITAIRDFINHRYPKLKNSRLNLCMTDVCVQARRVKTNQTKRSGDTVPSVTHDSINSPPHSLSSHSHQDDDLHVSAPCLPLALEQRPLSPCLNLCMAEIDQEPAVKTEMSSDPVPDSISLHSNQNSELQLPALSPPSSDELEGKLVIETSV